MSSIIKEGTSNFNIKNMKTIKETRIIIEKLTTDIMEAKKIIIIKIIDEEIHLIIRGRINIR